MRSLLWCVCPVVSCFSASLISICDSLQGTVRNINMQWEVSLLVAYGKEYALGKGCVLLSNLSHHLQKSLGTHVFLQMWLRLSHFLPAYYSQCSCAFNKMVIFCHSSALVDVLFLWGSAQHLSVIPVSYIMTKCHIFTFCYAQWGEIINQHSWKLMTLSWKAPCWKTNPATIKTGKMLNTVVDKSRLLPRLHVVVCECIQ